MIEQTTKTLIVCALCTIVGLYMGYSMAYHDVITGCDNTGHLSDKQKLYSCEVITKTGKQK